MAAFLALSVPLTAEPTQAAAADGKDRYILVLAPGPGQKPNVAAAGGTVEHEWGNRIEVKVPPEALNGLKNHPRVKYMQFIAPNASSFAPAPSPTPSPGRGKQSSSIEAMASDPGITPSATWNWSTGTYSYDGAGNITGIGQDTFGYDTLSRLTSSVIYVNGSAKTESYTYDAAGNMITRNNNGLNISMPVNILTNRLSGSVYDGAGNMTSQGTHGTHSYTWDAVKMMARLTDAGGKQFDYIYTADDERIATKDINPGIWRWTIRGLDGKVLREYESPVSNPAAAWLWTEDYAYRDGQLAGAEREAAEGGRRHFHLDHLGTPRLITNATGDKLATHTYYPFGVEATALLQETTLGYDREDPMKFTGHERDHVGGTLAENVNYVDYMHARYYSPNLGRFLSVDPGQDWELAVPQSWNLYAYVRSNPINGIDPDGRNMRGVGFNPRLVPGVDYDQMGPGIYGHSGGFGPESLLDDDVPIVASISMNPVVTPTTSVASAPIVRGVSELLLKILVRNPRLAGRLGLGSLVAAENLRRAAQSTGPTVHLVTKLTQPPAVGRVLSAASGPGAETIASASRATGQIYRADIPRKLIFELQRAGLAQEGRMIWKGGTVVGTEYRFYVGASKYIAPFFHP